MDGAGASDTEGEAPRQEGAQLEDGGADPIQARQIGCPFQSVLIGNRRRGESRAQIPYETQTGLSGFDFKRGPSGFS